MDDETIQKFRTARHNLYVANAIKTLSYCESGCCFTYQEEFEHVQRDAVAGEERAVMYWTEFMRLRMTT